MFTFLYQYFLIYKSGLFDPLYYLQKNPDVREKDIDPIYHYLRFGWKEGRNPSSLFNLLDYTTKHPEVVQLGINPLIHYLLNSPNKKRSSLVQSDKSAKYCINYLDMKTVTESKESLEYIPYVDHSQEDVRKKIKAIAFYLPQFHPIPENNEWWGQGFTEWTNVGKAIPQYVGHYQPHLPGELGYYDLRVPEVQRRQIELAKNYGIYGFCFHYYWFNGKRLLERPIDQFVTDEKNDFPFCLCWANENWTRRWDGAEDDLLISQNHSAESDERFIADVIPYFKKKNYIRINGRPILVIYRVDILPDISRTIQLWKKRCEMEGIESPYLIAAQTFGFKDPRVVNFDAAVEFPPHNIQLDIVNKDFEFLNPSFTGNLHRFSGKSSLSEKYLELKHSGYKCFKTVCPGWDNNARKPNSGNIFTNSNPEAYREWLKMAIRKTSQVTCDDDMIFINAWNEWGEGAHLEPDRKFGYGYLEATYKEVTEKNNQVIPNSSKEIVHNTDNNNSAKIAVILHLFYIELFGEICNWLNNISMKYDIFVSLPKESADFQDTIVQKFPNARIRIYENKGRDIAPFLDIYREIYSHKYDALLKIHTKKSSHREDGEVWREDIFKKLLGSSKATNNIIDYLATNKEIGIIGPKGHVLDHRVYWGENKVNTLELIKKSGFQVEGDPEFLFVAGSMFWAKPEALRGLLSLPINFVDFEPEPLPADGMLPHAIERFFGLSASLCGFSISEIDKQGVIIKSEGGEKYAFAVPTGERLQKK